jgi:hypothetical protein
MSVEKAWDSDGGRYIIRDFRMQEIQLVHGLTVVGKWVWEMDMGALSPPVDGWVCEEAE